MNPKDELEDIDEFDLADMENDEEVFYWMQAEREKMMTLEKMNGL